VIQHPRSHPPRWLALPLLVVIGLATVGAQSPDIETLPVRGQVSLIGAGELNALVQVGPQGVLVVDTMTDALADRLLAAIRTLAGSRPIRYVVNTHAHPDFTGGNLKVAAAGSQLVAGNFAGQVGQAAVEGVVPQAFIVAHENVLTAMSAPTGNQPPTPFGAWPTDTFFQAEKAMYFNGEGIQLVHIPAASTDGDVLVFFRSSDVIAAGDIYSTVGYPRIDLQRGGNVNGVIEGLNRLVDLAISEQFTEGGTRIVPGRGRISDEFDVVEYRDMVTIVRDRVQAGIKKGLSLDQVKAARPTLDWEPRYGSTTGPWTSAMFVEAVYRSLVPGAREVR
jgi:glyoxylase-like metal-dependent hydrolase (beta-lactamase superfamily II)